MINELDVSDFKLRFCNENQLIARLIREHLRDWVEEPIMDVGCGLGDIAADAFHGKQVILLDRLDFVAHPVDRMHRRVHDDFFVYPGEVLDRPQTLLFSHVLQFLDENPNQLFERVRTYAAPKIISVLNVNDGFVGDLLEWAAKRFPSSNPEIDILNFPPAYGLYRKWEFTAVLRCPTFEELVKQTSYLLDINPTEEERGDIDQFLKARLVLPEFSIREEVRAYSHEAA